MGDELRAVVQAEPDGIEDDVSQPRRIGEPS